MMNGHWRRLLIQLAILVSMIVVYAFDDQVFSFMVAVSLIGLPVATWTVFLVLLWLSNKAPDIESLRDRVDDALSAAIASTAAAVVGAIIIGRLTGLIPTSSSIAPVFAIGVAFVVVTASIPSLNLLGTAVRVWLPMLRERGVLPGDRDRDDPPAQRGDLPEGVRVEVDEPS